MEQKKKEVRSGFLLVLTALIWGAAFVAQSEGMNYVGGFTFNGCRFFLGGLVLIPVMLLMRKSRAKRETGGLGRMERRNGLLGGVCCGLFLCLASSFQQFGIAETTVGKAGFITALYIVIVPVLGLFFGKRVGALTWLGVAVAAVGMYLLCITDGFTVARGDLLVFFCAVGFSFHILVIDYFSPKTDGVFLSCVQFFTAGILSLVLMLLFEKPSWNAVLAASAPILYAGLFSCGIGYTLQVVAQRNVDPVVASLLMSLESVFSLLAGWALLGQRLSSRELLGCVLVFAAVILAQLPAGETGKKQ